MVRRALIALSLFALPFSAARAEGFDVAMTVDDLPMHGKLPPGMTRLGITEAHLAAFRKYNVAEAFGFVNAAKVKADGEGGAVLDLWRKGGHPLGNHTHSHMNLERAPTLQDWQADVIAGEAAVAERMAGADWRYLRLAFLNDGGARRDAAFAFARERGYRIADVSLSFDDWAYTEAYARCVTRGDNAMIAAMKARYLGEVDAAIVKVKDDSQRVYGRQIPLVLLTHIGGWSAYTLPDVLARLEKAGARYVSLAKAQADPAYAAPGGGDMIARAARAKGIALAPKAEPSPALDLASVCQ